METCIWVAVLYNLIEDWCSWPKSTRHARIAYLEKEGSKPGEVMSYRPLTVTTPVCRRWATMRLRAMEQWIVTWVLPEMFAGVAQQGAVDAWYQVAMDIEEKMLDGTRFCGGAADIHKYFDQILRTTDLQASGACRNAEESTDSHTKGLWKNC